MKYVWNMFIISKKTEARSFRAITVHGLWELAQSLQKTTSAPSKSISMLFIYCFRI